MNNQTPMTRETAKLLNLVNYVPLEPCANGHTYLRSTKFGNCLACKNLKNAGVNLRTVANVTPMTRESAQALGLTSYIPLTPCVHGHTGPRNTKAGFCMECINSRKRKGATTETARPKQAVLYFLSPEAETAVRAYAAQWLEYDRLKETTT